MEPNDPVSTITGSTSERLIKSSFRVKLFAIIGVSNIECKAKRNILGRCLQGFKLDSPSRQSVGTIS
ncbi:hypothetical protein M0804_004489 [Polistes exclamans]|nr:hypothetical protein M0804_004489 [Polistes exclamans]